MESMTISSALSSSPSSLHQQVGNSVMRKAMDHQANMAQQLIESASAVSSQQVQTPAQTPAQAPASVPEGNRGHNLDVYA